CIPESPPARYRGDPRDRSSPAWAGARRLPQGVPTGRRPVRAPWLQASRPEAPDGPGRPCRGGAEMDLVVPLRQIVEAEAFGPAGAGPQRRPAAQEVRGIVRKLRAEHIACQLDLGSRHGPARLVHHLSGGAHAGEERDLQGAVLTGLEREIPDRGDEPFPLDEEPE